MPYPSKVITERPATEVWFRNAGAYIRELAEVGCVNVVFDYAYLAKRNIEPIPYCGIYFGSTSNWRCLVVYPDRTVMYQAGSNEPQAVWPTWSAADDSIDKLVKYMKQPWGQSDMCNNEYAHKTWRPIRGQRHLIMITDLPDMNHESSKQFMIELSDFQLDHPEVTFFIHGLYSYPVLFGNDFKMVDIEARTCAANGKVQIPPGKRIYPHEAEKSRYWIEILGFTIPELEDDPKARCKYNIKSAIFAGSYWKKLERFAVKRGRTYFWETDSLEKYITSNSVVYNQRLARRPGDRIVCDDCSLWMSCKYFREESVCAVPESDMSKIAEMFGTRDSTRLQAALSLLMKANTERIERGMRVETQLDKDGEEKPVDPALSKLIMDTFKMGHTFLQIVDPAMRPGKPTVSVNIGSTAGGVEITQGGPRDEQALVSRVVGMLEMRGFNRDQITPEMINMAIVELSGQGPQTAIAGEVEP